MSSNPNLLLGGYKIRRRLSSIYSKEALLSTVQEERGPIALITKVDDRTILINDCLNSIPIFYNGYSAAFDPKLLNEPKLLPAGSLLVAGQKGIIVNKYTTINVKTGGTYEKMLYILKEYIGLLPHRKIAIAFSGGLDSSLLAWLARKKEPLLLTVGVKGSADLLNADLAAAKMDMENEQLEITDKDVINASNMIYNSSFSAMDKAIAIGFNIISRYAALKGIQVLLAGQLADELFGGYRRYSLVPSGRLNSVLRRDLYLSRRGLIRDSLAVLRGGTEFNLPYAHKDFVGLALGLGPEEKVSGGLNKIALREIGRLALLPDLIVGKKKKAFQYGSGLLKIVNKLGL